jgi:signal transduction histidine kinase
MSLLSSLTNRIFLAAALLAVVSIGFAIFVVNRTVTREAESELRRGLDDAGTLVDQYRTTLFDDFKVLARLLADLPKLKAAADTGDAPTVQDIAKDYQKLAPTDLFVVTDKRGRVLGAVGSGVWDGPDAAASIARAMNGAETSAFWPHPDGVLQVLTLPIYVEGPARETLGTLSVGFLLGDRITAQFKSVTESEIAWAAGGRVLASTLPSPYSVRLAALVRERGSSAFVPSIVLGDNDYVAMIRPLMPTGSNLRGSPSAADAPVAIILRSRTERLRFLNTIHTALAVTAIFAVLLATVLSYGIARTMTRPLGTITAAMREMADTGDLTRKIALRRRRWDDEDARLLASTFNTLTDSIARFQRDAAQRERLSSLGRLSTVIAHEIRNPLMIIKASLRTVRREDAAPHERAEAASDIDEEIGRLNRVVNDVLDFARPIRFECRPVDFNRLCHEAAAATTAADPFPPVRVKADEAIGDVTVDAERLRLVLVNMLTNARHAVVERQPVARDAAAAGGSRRPVAIADVAPIELRTERLGDDRVSVIVKDRGVGIAPQDLSRIFDPYFTTKRTGSGLGLPIAKNIIEGLGGSIAIASRQGEGTEIRIVLPRICRSS